MDLGRSPGPTVRLWLRPPGLSLTIVALLAALALLADESVPAGYFWLKEFGFLSWMVVGGIWLMWLTVALAVAWYYWQPTFKRRATWLRWGLVPTVFLLMLLLIALRAPLYVRFWMSRPAMEELARDLQDPACSVRPGTWAGLYRVRNAERTSGGARITVHTTELDLKDGGFVYSPDMPPEDDGWTTHTFLGGGWYVFVYSFP